MINIGILGHGTVGSGVVEVLLKNAESITRKAGQEIHIKKILDIRDFLELNYNNLFTKDANEILDDDDIDVIVEVLGGLDPSYQFVTRAMQSGKHVVTSNKELVARFGGELSKLARECNVNFLFEASVGGGIPIIRPLNQCLAANEISVIMGILNGTTNYILTKMKGEDVDFLDALADAQKNGYAEKDPSADVDGIDARRKIAILAAIAFGKAVRDDEIFTEGIRDISKVDMKYAEKLGYTIKLVASAEKKENGIMMKVCPVMLDFTNPLANVEDVFNGILVKGDAIGDVMFYGRGAGRLPTASAVVADIIDTVKHLKSIKKDPHIQNSSESLLDIRDMELRYFIRISYFIKAEAQETISIAFPACTFFELDDNVSNHEFAVITAIDKERNLQKNLENLKKQSDRIQIHNRIRITND